MHAWRLICSCVSVCHSVVRVPGSCVSLTCPSPARAPGRKRVRPCGSLCACVRTACRHAHGLACGCHQSYQSQSPPLVTTSPGGHLSPLSCDTELGAGRQSSWPPRCRAAATVPLRAVRSGVWSVPVARAQIHNSRRATLPSPVPGRRRPCSPRRHIQYTQLIKFSRGMRRSTCPAPSTSPSPWSCTWQ